MSNETVALQFFDRWGRSFDEMCASFEDTFSPDCRWDQRPLAVTVGTKEAIKFLNLSRKLMGVATIDVKMLKIASAGNSVLCERIDHIRKKDGRIIASAAVVGILDFREGQIVNWREYFDPVDFVKQTCINLIKGTFSSRRPV